MNLLVNSRLFRRQLLVTNRLLRINQQLTTATSTSTLLPWDKMSVFSELSTQETVISLNLMSLWCLKILSSRLILSLNSHTLVKMTVRSLWLLPIKLPRNQMMLPLDFNGGAHVFYALVDTKHRTLETTFSDQPQDNLLQRPIVSSKMQQFQTKRQWISISTA